MQTMISAQIHPMTSVNDVPITLLQWSIHGFRSKLPTLHLTLAEQHYDVVLQETLLKSSISITNYTGSHLYYNTRGSRGFSIFVCKDLHIEPLSLPRSCGTNIEAPSLSKIRNHICIYRPPRDSAILNLDHLFASISTSSIVCGDFNSHDPAWNDPSSPPAHRTRSGTYLTSLLQDFPQVSLLNRYTNPFQGRST